MACQLAIVMLLLEGCFANFTDLNQFQFVKKVTPEVFDNNL